MHSHMCVYAYMHAHLHSCIRTYYRRKRANLSVKTEAETVVLEVLDNSAQKERELVQQLSDLKSQLAKCENELEVYACMCMHACMHVYVCMHGNIHTYTTIK
jgi:hypothetical protein